MVVNLRSGSHRVATSSRALHTCWSILELNSGFVCRFDVVFIYPVGLNPEGKPPEPFAFLPVLKVYSGITGRPT